LVDYSNFGSGWRRGERKKERKKKKDTAETLRAQSSIM
jgi:hypothetical protein